jgi:hypothetical protein
MGFNDWIKFDSAPMALDHRLSEIDEEAKTGLAAEIQTRVRGRIDPGIDLKSARRAQKVRVKAEGGNIVIDEMDQDAVLRQQGNQPQRDISEARAGGVADLFTMSSGVPEAVRAPDGSNRMVFRSVHAEQLFGQQEQDEQNRVVEQTVTETVRAGIVNAFEKATGEVERRYPEDKLK